jgi:hypothetical protein
MIDPNTLTVDELIAASAELDDRADGLLGRLGEVTARAASREHGIEVTVNVDGMLVGLELTPGSLDLGPRQLAAEIFRLAQQASGSALSQGLAILAPVAGAELSAELAELVGPPAPVPEPVAPDSRGDEDFSAIERWALPR